MPGLIRSPLDVSQYSLRPDESSSLPLIPNLTQMAPGLMRAIKRQEMGYGEEDDASVHEPESPEEMFSVFASLFSKAGEFPGLQDSILAMLTQMKLAFDREAMMHPPIQPMPPVMSPQQMMAAPQQQQSQFPLMPSSPPQDAPPQFPLR